MKKRNLVILFALVLCSVAVLAACSTGPSASPAATPTQTPQIDSNLVGTWKIDNEQGSVTLEFAQDASYKITIETQGAQPSVESGVYSADGQNLKMSITTATKAHTYAVEGDTLKITTSENATIEYKRA